MNRLPHTAKEKYAVSQHTSSCQWLQLLDATLIVAASFSPSARPRYVEGWILVIAGGAELGLTFASDLRNTMVTKEVLIVAPVLKALSLNDGKDSGGLGVVGLATTGLGLYCVGVIRM